MLPFSNDMKSGPVRLTDEPCTAGDEQRRKLRCRFTCSRVSIFFVIIVLLGLSVGHGIIKHGLDVILALRGGATLGDMVRGDLPTPHDSQLLVQSLNSYETTQECVQWKKHPDEGQGQLSASASISLGLPSNLFFYSDIKSRAHGQLKVSQAETHGDVTVDLDIRYPENTSLDVLKACRVRRSIDRGAGVVLITPKRERKQPMPDVHFIIHVKLPKPYAGRGHYGSFISSFFLFAHEFDQGEGITFGTLMLISLAAPIHAKLASGANIILVAAYAPISGTIHANSSLSVQTIGAPIHVQLGLHNEFSALPTRATIASMASHINVNAELTTVPGNGGGNFDIRLNNTKGPIDFYVEDAPVGSLVTVQAKTILGAVNVHLHPTYQGAFHLETVGAQADLTRWLEIQDPSGKHRERQFIYTRRGFNRLIGETWWGSAGEDRPKGSVTLVSKLGGVNLDL